jgi:hypothetical protein
MILNQKKHLLPPGYAEAGVGRERVESSFTQICASLRLLLQKIFKGYGNRHSILKYEARDSSRTIIRMAFAIDEV